MQANRRIVLPVVLKKNTRELFIKKFCLPALINVIDVVRQGVLIEGCQ